MRGLVAAMALGAALACAPPATEQAAEPPAVDSAGVTQAVEDLWSRYSAADTAGNVDAVMALYTETARLDVPGVPPALGRAAIDSVARMMTASRDLNSLMIHTAATYVVSNEMAYTRGTYMETYVANKKSATDYGRYASAVVKGADGQWRIQYLMAFPDSTVQGR